MKPGLCKLAQVTQFLLQQKLANPFHHFFFPEANTCKNEVILSSCRIYGMTEGFFARCLTCSVSTAEKWVKLAVTCDICTESSEKDKQFLERVEKIMLPLESVKRCSVCLLDFCQDRVDFLPLFVYFRSVLGPAHTMRCSACTNHG